MWRGTHIAGIIQSHILFIFLHCDSTIKCFKNVVTECFMFSWSQSLSMIFILNFGQVLTTFLVCEESMSMPETKSIASSIFPPNQRLQKFQWCCNMWMVYQVGILPQPSPAWTDEGFQWKRGRTPSPPGSGQDSSDDRFQMAEDCRPFLWIYRLHPRICRSKFYISEKIL